MKRLMIVLLMVFTLLTLSACEPEVYSGKLILDGKHTLVMVDGDLVITGGHIVLKEGSHVTGSVYMLNGDLKADGTIRGDVSLIAGILTLGPHAQVQGDLKIGAGTLSRSPEAIVGGKVMNSEAGMQVPLTPAWWNDQSVLAQMLWFLGRALLVAVLALLCVRFVPKRTARISQAITEHPVITGALGLLTLVVALSLLVFMAFTIILLPVTILGILLLGAAVVYGWIAIGLEFGRHLVRLFRWKVQSAVAAFLGTLLFIVVVNGIGFIPYIGAVASMLSAAIGLGAVLLTRLGMRMYVPAADAVVLNSE